MNCPLTTWRNSGTCADLTLALVNQGLPLIKLDIGQNEATLLSSVRVPIVETDDLVQVIEHALDVSFVEIGEKLS